MNFSRFLKIQEHRKDVVGGFARLVSYRDDLFPPIHSSSYNKWARWLNQNNPTVATISTFKAAWAEYDKHYRNIPSLSDFRKHKATRNPSETEHTKLHRLHRRKD